MNTETYADIEKMVGVTMVRVERVGEELHFTADDGRLFAFYYSPDCCASCDLVDIDGDLSDLVGTPITLAKETTGGSDIPPRAEGYDPESYTWTFYHYGTNRGRVVVRWYGTSNGYYSERATMRIETP